MIQTYPLTVQVSAEDGTPCAGTVTAVLSASAVDRTIPMGMCALLPGTPWTTGATGGPQQTLVTPDGRFLYALNQSSPGTVSCYAIANGVLTALGSSPLTLAVNQPYDMAITGSALFITGVPSGATAPGLQVLQINSGGSLTTWAPITVSDNINLTGVAAIQQYVIVTDTINAQVWVLKVSGRSLSHTNGSPYACGATPLAATLSADGQYLFVANEADSTIACYRFDPDGPGTLTPTATQALGGNPAALAATADGCLYTTMGNEGEDCGIQGFAIGAGATLTEIPGSPWFVAHSPQSVRVDPTGRFLYATIWDANEIAMFARGAGGTLSPIGSGTLYVPGAKFCGASVSPNGQYLYATDFGDDQVYGFGLTLAESVVFPSPITAVTDANGNATLNLWPNVDPECPTSYRVTVSVRGKMVCYPNVVMPARPANLSELIA